MLGAPQNLGIRLFGSEVATAYAQMSCRPNNIYLVETFMGKMVLGTSGVIEAIYDLLGTHVASEYASENP